MDFKYLETLYNSSKILDGHEIKALETAANVLRTQASLATQLNEAIKEAQQAINDAGIVDIKIFFTDGCKSTSSKIASCKILTSYLKFAKQKLAPFGDSKSGDSATGWVVMDKDQPIDVEKCLVEPRFLKDVENRLVEGMTRRTAKRQHCRDSLYDEDYQF